MTLRHLVMPRKLYVLLRHMIPYLYRSFFAKERYEYWMNNSRDVLLRHASSCDNPPRRHQSHQSRRIVRVLLVLLSICAHCKYFWGFHAISFKCFLCMFSCSVFFDCFLRLFVLSVSFCWGYTRCYTSSSITSSPTSHPHAPQTSSCATPHHHQSLMSQKSRGPWHTGGSWAFHQPPCPTPTPRIQLPSLCIQKEKGDTWWVGESSSEFVTRGESVRLRRVRDTWWVGESSSEFVYVFCCFCCAYTKEMSDI